MCLQRESANIFVQPADSKTSCITERSYMFVPNLTRFLTFYTGGFCIYILLYGYSIEALLQKSVLVSTSASKFFTGKSIIKQSLGLHIWAAMQFMPLHTGELCTMLMIYMYIYHHGHT